MGEKGIDVSEWQAGMDTERVSRENGLSFAMVRTNYGSNHDDLQFHRLCDGFERAGVIVTPYCYPLATDTKGSVDDAVRIIGGRYKRLIIDWEHGSGNGDHLRAAHMRAWDHGFRTPLVYDPKWYWELQGSPNVNWMGESGRIGGHWKSWYPDNIAGSFDWILSKLPPYVWDDFRGGIPTLIVQFSSSVILNGWGGKVDANYFRGSRSDLETLLLGGTNDMSERTEALIENLNDWWLEGGGDTDRAYTGEPVIGLSDTSLAATIYQTRRELVQLRNDLGKIQTPTIDYTKLAAAFKEAGLVVPTAQENAAAFVAEMKKEGN